MTKVFNPPPHWPEPPTLGWIPPKGWRPDRAWGPVPAGWRLWVDPEASVVSGAPLLESEDVPASGARPRPRVPHYPVTVHNPGIWEDNPLESEDYGFGPAPEVRDRPRLRLAVTIVVAVLGLLVAVATTLLFVWLVHEGAMMIAVHAASQSLSGSGDLPSISGPGRG